MLMLDEDYVVDLERIAAELGVTPEDMLERLTGSLKERTVVAGMTAATADGSRPIITGGAQDL